MASSGFPPRINRSRRLAIAIGYLGTKCYPIILPGRNWWHNRHNAVELYQPPGHNFWLPRGVWMGASSKLTLRDIDIRRRLFPSSMSDTQATFWYPAVRPFAAARARVTLIGVRSCPTL